MKVRTVIDFDDAAEFENFAKEHPTIQASVIWKNANASHKIGEPLFGEYELGKVVDSDFYKEHMIPIIRDVSFEFSTSQTFEDIV